jgi:hypothetical protein
MSEEVAVPSEAVPTLAASENDEVEPDAAELEARRAKHVEDLERFIELTLGAIVHGQRPDDMQHGMHLAVDFIFAMNHAGEEMGSGSVYCEVAHGFMGSLDDTLTDNDWYRSKSLHPKQ